MQECIKGARTAIGRDGGAPCLRSRRCRHVRKEKALAASRIIAKYGKQTAHMGQGAEEGSRGEASIKEHTHQLPLALARGTN